MGGDEETLACVERLLRGATALVEELRGAAVDGREVATEQARDRAAEPVNRLVRVADHDEARMRRRRRDELEQLELRGVDVLELVHEDEAKPLPQALAERCVRLQQLDRSRDEVAKVEHAGTLEAQLVSLVDRGQHAKPLACARLGCKQEGRGVDEVLLHQRDKGQEVAREGIRSANSFERAEQRRVELDQDLSHDKPFLESVEQQAVAIGGVLTQEASAEAVKGRDPRFAVFILQALVDASRDLVRRAGREGKDQDLSAAGQALADRLLVQVDQGVRLAGARSGEHAQWSVYFVDVEWQRCSPGWRGRPDYAGARVLKSAAPVKGCQATTRRATSSAYSIRGN